MKFVILSLLIYTTISMTPKLQNQIKSDSFTPLLFNHGPLKTCDSISLSYESHFQPTFINKVISSFSIVPHKKQSLAEFIGVGLDSSAYFFDYMDDTIALHIAMEFSTMWNNAKKEPLYPEDVYKDTYSLSDPNLIENKNEFENSITTRTIFALIQNKKINIDSLHLSSSSNDIPLSIVSEYDFNGDGRLNAKEFLHLIIDISVAEMSKSTKRPFKNLIDVLIKKLFDTCDLCHNGYVKAEGIWKAMRNLNRVEKENYDIYKCTLYKRGNMRTSAVNDFVIKMMNERDGMLNRKEFTKGILYGYLNRNVKGVDVSLKDDFNLKQSRWNKGKDQVCEKIVSYYQNKDL